MYNLLLKTKLKLTTPIFHRTQKQKCILKNVKYGSGHTVPLRYEKSGLHIVNHRKRVQYLTKQADVTKYCMSNMYLQP